MIEIEKKFVIDNKIKSRIVLDAEFVCRKILNDTYYDDTFFSLTKKDMWLRLRNDRFELKIPADITDKGAINQYKELEDERLIKQILKLSGSESLTHALPANNYNPFCILTTTREKYKKGKFLIDIDTVYADNFNYSIAEIELMIKKKSQMKTALDQMRLFMRENNISENPVRGKVIEYIRQNNPLHYELLLTSGVIKS